MEKIHCDILFFWNGTTEELKGFVECINPPHITRAPMMNNHMQMLILGT